MQAQRRRVKRQVNQRFLTAMLDMGIILERAELALCETGNVGVEVRMWLTSEAAVLRRAVLRTA